MGALSAPGHMESTLSVHNTTSDLSLPGAIWTPRGEGRFTGVILPPPLKKYILLSYKKLKNF
jgi:hypothetical protein